MSLINLKRQINSITDICQIILHLIKALIWHHLVLLLNLKAQYPLDLLLVVKLLVKEHVVVLVGQGLALVWHQILLSRHCDLIVLVSLCMWISVEHLEEVWYALIGPAAIVEPSLIATPASIPATIAFVLSIVFLGAAFASIVVDIRLTLFIATSSTQIHQVSIDIHIWDKPNHAYAFIEALSNST